ncbi:hypothetical protein [Candidatus Coxiella mudrowiae]|uniref:hypothetical protein n=1 Tax=Candidatus Coxiella mudrowiae TaxID=2054173 RepID=UPI000C28D715|nr:hypothetical protein [Candidatus Coxiella mudrowiae]
MNKVTILYKIKSLRKTSNDFICEVDILLLKKLLIASLKIPTPNVILSEENSQEDSTPTQTIVE